MPAGTAWLVSALYLATATGQPVVGRLVDRYGPRRLYLTGTTLVGVAGVLGVLAPSLGVLIGARALLGLGTCAGYPAAMYLLRSESRRTGVDSPGGVLTALAVSAQTIVVIGPTLGGLLIGLGGWRTVFAVNIRHRRSSAVAGPLFRHRGSSAVAGPLFRHRHRPAALSSSARRCLHAADRGPPRALSIMTPSPAVARRRPPSPGAAPRKAPNSTADMVPSPPPVRLHYTRNRQYPMFSMQKVELTSRFCVRPWSRFLSGMVASTRQVAASAPRAGDRLDPP